MIQINDCRVELNIKLTIAGKLILEKQWKS